MNEIIQAILEIPGVVKAVAKLVGGSAAAGAAWIDVAAAQGEQKAAEIRGITDARTEVRNAMTKSLVNQIGSDGGLGQRALEHFATEILESQRNREEVTRLAIGYLESSPPKSTPSSEPSDDWLNIFSIYAERASSENVRAHWASILAGEIRRPGAISLLTLKMMSAIDHNNASVVAEFMKYVLDSKAEKFIPLSGLFGKDPIYSKILTLDALGFLTVGMHEVPGLNYTCGEYLLKTTNDPVVPIRAAILTQAGNELSMILGQTVELNDVTFIKEQAALEGCLINIYNAASGELISALDNTSSV